MIRRLVVTGVGVLGAVALAASPASAASTSAGATGSLSVSRPSATAPHAPYTYRLFNRGCGGAHDLHFNATQFENGKSGTQRFRQKLQLQQYSAGAWRARSAIKNFYSTRFRNNTTSHKFALYLYGDHSDGGTWRLVWSGQWLNGAGNVIAKTGPKVGVQCG